MLEAFHVVSMETGELLFSVTHTSGLHEHVDAEIEELKQSLKLYGIYCLMKQCATDEEGGDCWMENGAFYFMFKELPYYHSEEIQIPAVMILVKSAKTDVSEARRCFNGLVDASSLASGGPGSRRDRCKSLLNRS